MINKNELLQQHYEKILMDIAGVNTPEQIFENLDAFSKSVSKFGEEQKYIPLQIKKMLAFILDPEYRIEYKVNKTDRWCEVEAFVYWSGSDVPSGTGFKKLYVDQVRRNDMISVEERESGLEATVRGAAASRALTDAGIGMEFYGDLFDTDIDKEDAERSLDLKVATTAPTATTVPTVTPGELTGMPSLMSNEEKKAQKRRQKAAQAQPVAEAPKQEVPTQEFTANETPAQEEVPAPVSAEASMSIDEARAAIVDIGTFAGSELGTLFDTRPKTLIWLVNNNSVISEACKVLINTEPELAQLLN